MFEALFDKRLKPTDTFAQALISAGYDARKAQPSYSTEVWVRCLAVARQHHYAGSPDAQAYRRLGFEFSEGFLQTIVGGMVGAVLPLLSPLGFLNRLGKYFTMGRNNGGLRFEMLESEEGRALIEVMNPAGVPGEFVAGIIEMALTRMHLRHTLVVTQTTPYLYRIEATWSKPA